MGKRIEISVGFAAMLCIMGWVDLKLCIYFLLSVFVHEIAHLLAMRICGLRVLQISLRLHGALIRCENCSYVHEVICAAAGPAASLVLTVAMLRIAPKLAVVSFLLGCGNLLPIYPMDGGRILRAVLMKTAAEETASSILAHVTLITCCILMACACWLTAEMQIGLWPVFAALVVLSRVGAVQWRDL